MQTSGSQHYHRQWEDKYKGRTSNSCPQQKSISYPRTPGMPLLSALVSSVSIRFGDLHSAHHWVHLVSRPNSIVAKIAQSFRFACQQLFIADAVKQGSFSTWKGEDVMEEQVQKKVACVRSTQDVEHCIRRTLLSATPRAKHRRNCLLLLESIEYHVISQGGEGKVRLGLG